MRAAEPGGFGDTHHSSHASLLVKVELSVDPFGSAARWSRTICGFGLLGGQRSPGRIRTDSFPTRNAEAIRTSDMRHASAGESIQLLRLPLRD